MEEQELKDMSDKELKSRYLNMKGNLEELLTIGDLMDLKVGKLMLKELYEEIKRRGLETPALPRRDYKKPLNIKM